jgi:hypothetical protein
MTDKLTQIQNDFFKPPKLPNEKTPAKPLPATPNKPLLSEPKTRSIVHSATSPIAVNTSENTTLNNQFFKPPPSALPIKKAPPLVAKNSSPVGSQPSFSPS